MKVLIINDIRYYWGDASSPGGTCPHLGERVLTGGDAISPGGERNLTWGRRVPASALSSWGSMPQLGNTMIREGACFVFACQGIEPCQANADAGTRRPQVRLRPPPDETASPQVRLRPPPNENASSSSFFSL